MLSNLHTQSRFCDGKNTPEEIVLAAMDEGLSSIGFSGHGYTEFDLRYCMKDTAGYISEIKRLKEKYKEQIQIYLGVEEDCFYPVNRKDFDYIIGSSHYYLVDGEYYPIDSNLDRFRTAAEKFQNDPVKMAHAYYKPFCKYINDRKPDVVGHFDLISKFDEVEFFMFLENKEYNAVAEEYMKQAAKSGCLFEVNTGAMSRGYRTSPYPAENLLQILRENGNGLVLAADSHSAETLSFAFSEMRKYLKMQGFEYVYALYDGEFVKDCL